MATERLSMRQIREILRQKWTLGRTHRQVAEGLRVGLGTVSTVEHRARAAGLDWTQVDTLSDEALEARAPPTADESDGASRLVVTEPLRDRSVFLGNGAKSSTLS